MKILTICIFSIIFLFASSKSVDINNATLQEFESLKGIGSNKAKAIIKYRDREKCFKSINDFTNVKGIGKSILNKNKSNLTLGRCKK